MLLEFLRSEDGAVATDWVFMTTAVTTTALATVLNTTSVGVDSIANDLADTLAEIEIQQTFQRSILMQDTFEAGTTGSFVGGALGYSDELSNLLRGGGSDGEQMARATYDLDPDLEYAVMSFDMVAIDSWDGENFNVYVNDEVVATASFDYRANGVGTWQTDNPDVSVSISHNDDLGNMGFDNGWPDQSASMQITVRNPGEQVSLGFGSTLDQGVDDESWGVDNVRVVSTNSP